MTSQYCSRNDMQKSWTGNYEEMHPFYYGQLKPVLTDNDN